MREIDPARLTKLMLMLSSDHDGEVVAAARAVGKCLRDAGNDWHWFAARLRDVQPKPQQREERSDAFVTDEDRRLISELCALKVELNSRAARFVSQMFDHLQVYGSETFISARQREYLRSLYHQRGPAA